MQQKLIIFLCDENNDHPDWIVMDGSSVILRSENNHQQDLSSLAQDKKVIVLVPTQDVLLTSAKLPSMHRSRLLQVLPYALEEQVIGEVEAMHFVAGECQADGSFPVAIVSREKMQTWLNQLQTLQIQPDTLIPLVMALPVKEKTWVLALHHSATVRMHAYQGFACENENLHELLNHALHSVQDIPEHVHVYNYTEHAFANTLPATINVQEEWHNETQFAIQLGYSALTSPCINLLQGKYKRRKSRFPQRRKIWKSAIALSMVWLLLLFLYPAVSYFMLKTKAVEIDQGIAKIYQKHFPDAHRVVAPRLRMQEKLKTFTAEASDKKLLLLIGYLGKDMNEVRGITVKRLDFQDKRLTLELIATSSETLSRLIEALMGDGLHVKQDNANLSGTSVNAVLTVE